MVKLAWSCTHCGSRMKQWRVPEEASWDTEVLYVCFNDSCSYYQRGWEWMREQYSQKLSYRYAVHPETGARLMIPVWSDTATRDRIIDTTEGGSS